MSSPVVEVQPANRGNWYAVSDIVEEGEALAPGIGWAFRVQDADGTRLVRVARGRPVPMRIDGRRAGTVRYVADRRCWRWQCADYDDFRAVFAAAAKWQRPS